MDATPIVVVTLAIFLWGAVSARWERADLSAPMVFTAVGAAMAAGDLVHPSGALDALKPLVQVTLVWVLFSDAARVPVHALRADTGILLRLLAVGLPLTVLAGWGLAGWMLPAIGGGWLALVVGAALAPTDAALGAALVTNPAVPLRVRRVLSVESGLNDGIATPVVMLALAGATSAEGGTGAPGPAGALLELAVGAGVGLAVGGAGGGLLRCARHRGWVAEEFAGAAVLALALAVFATAIVLEGNGFVAAFCGGLAFGAAAGRRGTAELVFTEQAGSLVSLLVWLGFGALAVPVVVDHAGWSAVGYAVLSLTVVRMVPVALVLLGSGLDRDAVLFIGWFGPRGLASLLFALLSLEELGAAADPAVAVIAVTVVLSVLAHGVSARPLAARYGRTVRAGRPARTDPGRAAGTGRRSGTPRARPRVGRRRPAGAGDDHGSALPDARER